MLIFQLLACHAQIILNMQWSAVIIWSISPECLQKTLHSSPARAKYVTPWIQILMRCTKHSSVVCNIILDHVIVIVHGYMDRVTKVRLSCYLVLLSKHQSKVTRQAHLHDMTHKVADHSSTHKTPNSKKWIIHTSLLLWMMNITQKNIVCGIGEIYGQ